MMPSLRSSGAEPSNSQAWRPEVARPDVAPGLLNGLHIGDDVEDARIGARTRGVLSIWRRGSPEDNYTLTGCRPRRGSVWGLQKSMALSSISSGS